VLLLALAAALGQFEAHSDLGSPAAAGNATFNGATQEYVLKPTNTPHFAWKRIKGDFVLQASVEFLEKEPGPQANAGLVLRTGTGAGSSFAGVVVRNDRQAAIQYRIAEGGMNDQSEATLTTGDVIQLERRGSTYYFSAARFGVPLYTRQRADLPFADDLYVGLAASAATAFRNVRIARPTKQGFALEVVDVENGRRQIVYRSAAAFEAPMWTPDGSSLTFTASGKLVRLDLQTRQAVTVAADIATRSDGWSPDDRYRTFSKGTGNELDIYRAASDGLGRELRLTATKGADAAPEYAPDGNTIYFHSSRTGKMQVWRMGPMGENPQAATADELDNRYPHISPDGKWVAMLSRVADPVAPAYLRVMPVEGGVPRVIAYVFGSENLGIPAWSPDGTLIAFVSNADPP
jgi:dipeptidyl aminopeptidase/acylaminoacyl peptidase